ncbi:MAG: hypothetical protein IH933_04180 [Euryarchaeota archaeon]|nr:hypothetical protein [Euryarchaeota archaeon]
MFTAYDDPGLVVEQIAEELPIERDALNDRLDGLYERSLLDSEDVLRTSGRGVAVRRRRTDGPRPMNAK